VNSNFNDVFGFFVSGPGLNGPFTDNAINAALVPGTSDAVSINTINHTTNSSSYIPNELNADQILCGLDQVVNPKLQLIEYDGLTTVLTAELRLFPCETYHIRLVIADVGDANLDSAVLLEAGSFDLGGSVSLEAAGVGTISDRIFEGCDSGGFRVVRGTDSDPNTDQTINYRFGANSEAQEGIDFTNPGGSVTIPAGEMFIDVTIPTIADGIVEGPENLWVILDIPCACYTDSTMIIIEEPGPLVVNLEEAYYCPNQTATLDAQVSGGSPPYTYLWSTGNTEANPTLSPPLPASIMVNVTDACGQQSSQVINTFSSIPPTATFLGQEIEACWGEQRSLQIELTGQAPFTVTYSRSGNLSQTIEFADGGLQEWPIDEGGRYDLLNVQDQVCNGSANGSVLANFYRPVINPNVTHPSCATSVDGQISIQHLPSVPPYQYEWTGTNATGRVADSLAAGSYSLRVIDALGCADERSFELRQPSPLLPLTLSCADIRQPPLRLSAAGGRAPYLYSIDGGNTFWSAAGFAELIPGQYYDVLIQDTNGCELLQTDFFYPEASPRNMRLPPFIGQELGGSIRIEPEFFVPVDQIAELRWHPAEYFDCPSCRTPTVSAPFSQAISVAVEDIFGCRDSLVTWLGVDGRVPIYIPNIFSPNGDGNNDFVAVFANADQISRVISFRIYSRWGSLVYEDFDFIPNSARRGWDGLINGEKAPLGAYPWIAEFS
ncbi:MAG: choice-of-anchor L domain-containing protein, partial [Bacteroidota bacterium]